MIISRTPFRISFFGGGTDYPAWYRTNGGSVLGTTIDKYCYITCRYLPPFFDHRFRVVYSKIENCKSVDEIQHPAVREVLRFLGVNRGVEIHHDGDLPARSGIGSSSAFTVGLLHAVHALKGHMPTKQELAFEGMHIEQDVLKETVGSQDQVLVAYGGFNLVAFHPDGRIVVTPMTLPEERVQDLNDHLVLFYTGVDRTASAVAASYVRNIEARERELRRLDALVKEAVALLSSGHDLRGFGALLHEAWQVKRDLSVKVSSSYIDQIYTEALSAGAVGGKLIGAGGGGFMLFFVPPAARRKVRERLGRLLHVPFRFDRSGSQIIFFERQAEYPADESPALTLEEVGPGRAAK